MVRKYDGDIWVSTAEFVLLAGMKLSLDKKYVDAANLECRWRVGGGT